MLFLVNEGATIMVASTIVPVEMRMSLRSRDRFTVSKILPHRSWASSRWRKCGMVASSGAAALPRSHRQCRTARTTHRARSRGPDRTDDRDLLPAFSLSNHNAVKQLMQRLLRFCRCGRSLGNGHAGCLVLLYTVRENALNRKLESSSCNLAVHPAFASGMLSMKLRTNQPAVSIVIHPVLIDVPEHCTQKMRVTRWLYKMIPNCRWSLA